MTPSPRRGPRATPDISSLRDAAIACAPWVCADLTARGYAPRLPASAQPSDSTPTTASAAALDSTEAPASVARPPRAQVAELVRGTAALLAAAAPGQSVEVRIPPFSAVQCIAGPVHRRGTPPNVVQTDVTVWLGLALGLVDWAGVGKDVDCSGTRAGEIAAHLPILRLPQ